MGIGQSTLSSAWDAGSPKFAPVQCLEELGYEQVAKLPALKPTYTLDGNNVERGAGAGERYAIFNLGG